MPQLIRSHSYHQSLFPISSGNDDQVKLSLELFEYHLDLRSAFGTSHSSTTSRRNALIRISINTSSAGSSCETILSGFGECGLPPKKANCYLADFEDIKFYFEQFCKSVKEYQFSLKEDGFYISQMCKDAFSSVDSKYFTQVKSLFENVSGEISLEKQIIPLILLNCLDKYEYIDQSGKIHPDFEHCAQCGIEMAIFDLWGSVLGKPLYSLIGIESPVQKFAFYTAALNEDVNEIVKTARFGLEKTRHLKIKLDSDIDKGIHIFKNLI